MTDLKEWTKLRLKAYFKSRGLVVKDWDRAYDHYKWYILSVVFAAIFGVAYLVASVVHNYELQVILARCLKLGGSAAADSVLSTCRALVAFP
jgi:hypothetical protein